VRNNCKMALTRVLGAAFRALPRMLRQPQQRSVVRAVPTMLQQPQQRFVVRAFSTTLSRPKDPEQDHPKGLVRAPIQVFGREGAYAHALYSAAVKENVLDTVEGDLKRISDFIEKEPRAFAYAKNPSILRKEKLELVQELVGKSSLSTPVKNLCVVMAENGALGIADGIIAAFNKIMCAKRQEIVIVVTTAKELNSGQESKLNAALKKFLKEGEILKMTKRIDPDLVGGMTVKIGDRFIDMSTAKKIRTYRDLISQPV